MPSHNILWIDFVFHAPLHNLGRRYVLAPVMGGRRLSEARLAAPCARYAQQEFCDTCDRKDQGRTKMCGLLSRSIEHGEDRVDSLVRMRSSD